MVQLVSFLGWQHPGIPAEWSSAQVPDILQHVQSRPGSAMDDRFLKLFVSHANLFPHEISYLSDCQ